MGKLKNRAVLERELNRLRRLQFRGGLGRENYLEVTGAMFAIAWALGVPNARAVALDVRDRVTKPGYRPKLAKGLL